MPLYELGIIVDPEAPPEDETSMVDKDARGRRQLAYPIKKKNYGVYHFWTFNVDGEALETLNFEMRTNDVVLRSLILNMDRELRRKRKMDVKLAARAEKKAAKAAAKAEAAASASATVED